MSRVGRGTAREAGRLATEARRLFQQGLAVPGALKFGQAGDVLRQAMDRESPDPKDLRQLGFMRYMQGQYLEQAEEYADAVAALDEAESVYKKAGAEKELREVVVRRGYGHALSGKPLSAIRDIQSAVLHVTGWAMEHQKKDRLLGAARVMGLASEAMLLAETDPDIAAEAADWAMYLYMTACPKLGSRLLLPPDHKSPWQSAAWVAISAHTAAGRAGQAAAAQAAYLRGDQQPLPDVAGEAALIRAAQPTLAQVLDRCGRQDLAAEMMPVPDGLKRLVPAMRWPAADAPRYARRLVELLDGHPGPPSDRARMRLCLEAHALFCYASEHEPAALRDRFGDFGPSWAIAVRTVGQLLRSDPFSGAGPAAPGAIDAAEWLAKILNMLTRFLITEPEARATAIGCLRWQQEVYTAAGDPLAAANAGRTLAILLDIPAR